MVNKNKINNNTVKNSENIIIGKNALKEVLKFKPNIIDKIFSAIPSIKLTAIYGKNILSFPIQEVSKEELDNLTNTSSHQGIATIIKRDNLITWKDLKKKITNANRLLIVTVDGVQDPHNLGAILRASACFNIDYFIASKNRSAPLTPIVSKVSVGASELINISYVSNLANTLKELKKIGCWIAILDEEGKDKFNSIKELEKIALVLGAEGRGVSPIIKKLTDFNISIQTTGKIKTLNVSQATAIALHSIRQEQKK